MHFVSKQLKKCVNCIAYTDGCCAYCVKSLGKLYWKNCHSDCKKNGNMLLLFCGFQVCKETWVQLPGLWGEASWLSWVWQMAAWSTSWWSWRHRAWASWRSTSTSTSSRRSAGGSMGRCCWSRIAAEVRHSGKYQTLRNDPGSVVVVWRGLTSWGECVPCRNKEILQMIQFFVVVVVVLWFCCGWG